MSRLFYALLACLMLNGSVDGATVSVLNIDPNTNPRNDGFTSTADAAGNVFTLTGTADFDGGGVNDTLVFALTRTTYTTGTISAGNVTVGTVNNGGNTNNWYSSFEDGETVQFDVSNITYTSGEADGTTAVFAGFTNFTRTDFAAGAGNGVDIDYLVHTGPIGSTTVTSSAGTTAVDLTSAGTSSTVFVTAEAGSDSIRIRDLDLQFETVTAVPEPTSFAILLGGLGMLTMRRRRA